MNWQVYIIACSDNSLYTGITTDVARRLGQHKSGRGAKYFRGRQPVELMYLESGINRSTAMRREAQIKKMERGKKCTLFSSDTNEMTNLEFGHILNPPSKKHQHLIASVIT